MTLSKLEHSASDSREEVTELTVHQKSSCEGHSQSRSRLYCLGQPRLAAKWGHAIEKLRDFINKVVYKIKVIYKKLFWSAI